MAEGRDSDEGGNKPVRASTLPRHMETPETELEWAQRVLEDSTAFSGSTDPARTEIVFGFYHFLKRRDTRHPALLSLIHFQISSPFHTPAPV